MRLAAPLKSKMEVSVDLTLGLLNMTLIVTKTRK